MLAEGRLLAVGPVRMLHRARRRQGGRQLQPLGAEGRGRDDHDARRSARRRSASGWRRRSRPPARCSAASARPGILVRVAALLERKGDDLDRDTAARHLGAHLCRCTGYVKILDAVELLAKGETRELLPLGGIGSSGTRYQGFDLALGDKPYVDDLRPTGCCTARSGSPTTRAPTCCASTPRPRPRCRASCACSPRPTFPASCASG